MSPWGVVLDPQGDVEVPERDLTLKFGIFQDAYTRRFIIIRININSEYDYEQIVIIIDDRL